MNEDDLITIGTITKHAFIYYNVFPLYLSKCALKYSLFNFVSDDEVNEGYCQFLSEGESKYFNQICNVEENQEVISAIMDIFSDNNILNPLLKILMNLL